VSGPGVAATTPGPGHGGVSWVAYLRLEDPAGLSPITTLGRYDTVEAVQVATDHVWASR